MPFSGCGSLLHLVVVAKLDLFDRSWELERLATTVSAIANTMNLTGFPNESDLDGYRIQSEFCKTMGHPIRLQILDALCQERGEVASARLLKLTGIPKPSLSQHLSKMQAAGLVTTRRAGRFLFVELACPEVGEACAQVRRALKRSFQDRAAQIAEKEQPKPAVPTWVGI